jgi:hypothetical protein
MQNRLVALEQEVTRNHTAQLGTRNQLNEVRMLVEQRAEHTEIKRAVDQLNAMTDGSLSAMEWRAKYGGA